MATTHDPKTFDASRGEDRPGRREPRRFLWTRDQYYALAELGFFRNRHVELIEGEIVEMSSFKPPHAIAIELMDSALRFAFGAGHRVRIQLPLDLGRRSQPEPDAVVLAGSPRDSAAHPTGGLLVVEISDATLRHDRGIKAHLYARAGVAEYWILNLVDRRLEVHRDPRLDPARRGRFLYASVLVIPADGHVSPLAALDVTIAVADLLPNVAVKPRPSGLGI